MATRKDLAPFKDKPQELMFAIYQDEIWHICKPDISAALPKMCVEWNLHLNEFMNSSNLNPALIGITPV